MRRITRRLGLAALIAIAGLGLFLVPTIWGKPWSIEHFYLRVFAELVLERPQLLSRLRILEPWGLDWFVQAGHGGRGNRNCTLVEDETLATPAYPFVAGSGPTTTWVNSGITPKGDVTGSGANLNMWTSEFQDEIGKLLATSAENVTVAGKYTPSELPDRMASVGTR